MQETIETSSATIVAFYGEKSTALEELILSTQDALSVQLGDDFAARPLHDVHSTIIGLDLRVEDSSPDPAGALGLVKNFIEQHHLEIQFGGFSPGYRGFLSNGDTLNNRTLTFNAGQVVLMGWPVRKATHDDPALPSDLLATLRRRCEGFGVRHKYHRRACDFDPDAYMVIGDLDTIATEDSRTAKSRLLESPTLGEPNLIEVRVGDVRLVRYEEHSLPRSTTTSWPLDQVVQEDFSFVHRED